LYAWRVNGTVDGEAAMPSDLIDFWQGLDLTKPPFAHPCDLPFLRKYGGRYIDAEPKDFESFISSGRFGDFTDNRFHLSLLPFPYCGDLRSADIVLLLLNPGFGFTDYYAETRMPQFRRRLERMLAQDFAGTDFPFLSLDPEFCWHSGFVYWEGKLREVISDIAKTQFGGRYFDALRDVSKRLACVELVPYHSPSFNAHRLIADLPSVRAAKCFAKGALVTAANQEKKTIIVPRSVRAWGLPKDTRNLVEYDVAHARGASLGRESKGGKAILKRYCI
jgi:hypothetical protein